MATLLIKNASILTPRGLIDGSMLIEGNRIAKIGKVSAKADTTIDAKGKIAIPGLVNAHTHVSMTILRGYGEDLPLERWLKEKIWPIEAKQTLADVEASANLSFCEMIRSGTTAFADTSLFDPSVIMNAAKKAGMRGIVAQSFLDFGNEKKTKQAIGRLEAHEKKRFEKSVGASERDLVSLSIAVHAPYSCSKELLIKAKETADKTGLKLQMHASETRKEIFDCLKERGKYPIEYLEDIGFLGEDCILAHAGWLTKREIALIGKRKASVASCPISNLKLATGGISQITELAEAGANVALGTDSAASNNCLDMFQTMKMASLMQKHHYWKADILSTQKTFDYATKNGASALGFDSGTIEPGKLADIILLERLPNLVPQHDLLSNLVFSAGAQNVTDSIINGVVAMRERRILTLDEARVMEQAEKSAQDIKTR